MKKELVLAVVLGVLLLVVAVQALQLGALNASLSSAKTTAFASGNQNANTVPQSAPAAPQGLPQQVGGC